MRRLLTASALFALAVYTATAAGQPPAPPRPDDPPGTKSGTEKKPIDPTESAIAAALANDPDVRMAKAKLQLAEAELAKARQAVTLKVLTLKARIEQLKAEVRATEERAAYAAKLVEKGAGTHAQLLVEREKLEAAKAALALAEAEWKLLTGTSAAGASGAATDPSFDKSVASALEWLSKHQTANSEAERLARFFAAMDLVQREAVKGPIPERVRAALDKPVKLGAKGERVTFEKALEAFKKDAGLDVPVRGPINQVGAITSEGEEMTVGAWFQLFEDHTFLAPHDLKGPNRKARFCVREYGILLAPNDSAPPDAPTLTDFWKQKPLAKTNETKTDPMPKK